MKLIEEAFCRAARLAEGLPPTVAECRIIRLTPSYAEEVVVTALSSPAEIHGVRELEQRIRASAAKRKGCVEPDQSPEARRARFRSYRQRI